MPIYDYACTVCGRVIEVVHGVNGQGPQACETCGGAMKKLLSTPAVHFKGSGWAKKDRGSSSTTKAAARSASGTDSASSSENVSRAGEGATRAEEGAKAGSTGEGPTASGSAGAAASSGTDAA